MWERLSSATTQLLEAAITMSRESRDADRTGAKFGSTSARIIRTLVVLAEPCSR